MRLMLPLGVCLAVSGWCQDVNEIVRKSVELDQANWMRMADYTWVGRSHERHFDSHNRVTSEHWETWETLILAGQPFQRMLERDRKPLPPDEQQKQNRKFDRETSKVAAESPEEQQKHADAYQRTRRRERAFLLEIPEAFELKLEGTAIIDGQETWVVSGTPKAGYHPKTREGGALLKVRGKIWIAKHGYQWVRVEGETTGTISYGLILARLNPGAKLVFEQTRVNDEVWLPKRFYVTGSGRIGLLKRLAEDEEITWSDYKKFRVESVLKAGVP
jgi:hypothetical protein